MTRNKRLLLLSVALLAIGLGNGACGASDDLTVEAVVEHQTESAESGVECEYTFISTEISVRLAHYRICEDDDNDKRLAALQNAIDDCVKVCADNADCLAQCGK